MKKEEPSIETIKKSNPESIDEEINTSVRSGENLGTYVQGHPYLKDDYEFCKIQLLAGGHKNEQHFDKEVQILEEVNEPIMIKFGKLLGNSGNDEDIKNVISQAMIAGFSITGLMGMNLQELLSNYLKLPQEDNKDNCEQIDRLLAENDKPFAENLRILLFAYKNIHGNKYTETIIKSLTLETTKKYLNYTLRAMTKNGHDTSMYFLEYLGRDENSDLLKLIDPLLLKNAIPFLLRRDLKVRMKEEEFIKIKQRLDVK